MAKKKKNEQDFFHHLLSEINKIDWKKVNELALKTFLITIVGDETSYIKVLDALSNSKYDFMGIKHTRNIPLTESAKSLICFVNAKEIGTQQYLIQNSDITIVDRKYISEINSTLNKFFMFNTEDTDELFERIISENSELEQALCYNYPAFRTISARKVINAISLQNAAWAAGTATPNIVPGLHQIITTPIEGLSDFVVLTLNEARMLFIIASMCGRKVNPFKLIPEFGIVFGGAKSAELLATNVVGKAPAGMGLAAKSAIAFAFTYAIGEAIYLNMNYFITFDKKVISSRMTQLKELSEQVSKNLIKKKQ